MIQQTQKDVYKIVQVSFQHGFVQEDQIKQLIFVPQNMETDLLLVTNSVMTETLQTLMDVQMQGQLIPDIIVQAFLHLALHSVEMD